MAENEKVVWDGRHGHEILSSKMTPPFPRDSEEKRVSRNEVMNRFVELEEYGVVLVTNCWLSGDALAGASRRWFLRIELSNGERKTVGVDELPEPIEK